MPNTTTDDFVKITDTNDPYCSNRYEIYAELAKANLWLTKKDSPGQFWSYWSYAGDHKSLWVTSERRDAKKCRANDAINEYRTI